MPTPDSEAGFRGRRGETDFQAATRQDFERLENQCAGYPACVERERGLMKLREARELMVAAAGKVS